MCSRDWLETNYLFLPFAQSPKHARSFCGLWSIINGCPREQRAVFALFMPRCCTSTDTLLMMIKAMQATLVAVVHFLYNPASQPP
jgi:hypothetical protein